MAHTGPRMRQSIGHRRMTLPQEIVDLKLVAPDKALFYRRLCHFKQANSQHYPCRELKALVQSRHRRKSTHMCVPLPLLMILASMKLPRADFDATGLAARQRHRSAGATNYAGIKETWPGTHAVHGGQL